VVVVGISIASVVIGYTLVNDLSSDAPPEVKALIGNKLIFMMNPVFWWFDFAKLQSDSASSPFGFFDALGHNFTIQLIAFCALMVVSVAALIGALATKPAGQTAALASSPYGY
jgi:hypothetical protein